MWREEESLSHHLKLIFERGMKWSQEPISQHQTLLWLMRKVINF